MSGPDGSSAGRAAGASRRRLVADPIHGPLPALMLVLTLLTGVVDILALNRVFVANMTGNVVFVGFALGAPAGSRSPRRCPRSAARRRRGREPLAGALARAAVMRA